MTAGAVLCGGSSRRMGTDKALVELAGETLAGRVGDALEAGGCSPVVLIGGDQRLLARLGRPTVADRWPGEGPGGGLLTALAALDDDLVVVAACDIPLLDAATVRRLIEAVVSHPETDVAVAATGRSQQSLTCWRRAARPTLETCWAHGARALHELVAAVRHLDVTVAPRSVVNVNTPADLSAAEGTASRCRYIDAVTVPEIDVDQLAEQLSAGARLIDVREPDEYERGHVPGAVLVPLGTVPDNVEAFAGDGPTYVICGGGGRSMRACEIVADCGGTGQTVNVAGGTRAWIASGRDTVGGDRPR